VPVSDLSSTPPEHADDDPDTWACYRHPGTETALRCVNCERPICLDCAVNAAVGMKCPDCARQNAAARGRVPVSKLGRGLVAAGVAAAVAGYLYPVLNVSFIGLIIAWFLGMGIGELARRASGGFRDPALARGAAAFTVLGFAWQPLLFIVQGGGPEQVIWLLVGAGVAAWSAFVRCA
jgi:hypothetical protein